MGLYHEHDAAFVKVTKIQDDKFTENNVWGWAHTQEFLLPLSTACFSLFTHISKYALHFFCLSLTQIHILHLSLQIMSKFKSQIMFLDKYGTKVFYK